MNFINFRNAIANQFTKMTTGVDKLFVTSVDPDVLWDTYLKSFPEGTNPVYIERTEADCSACRQVIKKIGNVIAINKDGERSTLWEAVFEETAPKYKPVAAALHALVSEAPIVDQFFYGEGSTLGCKTNYGPNGEVYNHFHLNLPAFVVKRNPAEANQARGLAASLAGVTLRGLQELEQEHIDTVLELIAQNSLYRGEEHKNAILSFQRIKTKFDTLPRDEQKADFAWANPHGIRNTAIGTLLVDLAQGVSVDAAVHNFGSKMVGYKRPLTAVTAISPKQYQAAQVAVEELGLTSALHRRYARLEDITVPNTIFVDRATKKEMGVFEELAAATHKPKTFDHVEEIGIEIFLSDIVPGASSLEVLFENSHTSNLVSLIAPEEPTAGNLFKWGNKFSWTYNGNNADSIKQRVKAAGGRVDGVDVRASLSWFNTDDLDLRVVEPNGDVIYFGDRNSSDSGGFLDVDMNVGTVVRDAVENIAFPSISRMANGEYKVQVHQFTQRETIDVGFDVQLEILGKSVTISYPKIVKRQDLITVATLVKEGNEVIIKDSLPTSTRSTDVWNIPTEKFHKVRILMMSPNHWDGEGVGNKHYFFMLEGCKNDSVARGFYNEFLKEELTPHRKVLEIVGQKLKVKEDPNQLSGLGFSSTQRAKILCKVTSGSLERVIRVII